MVFTVVVVCTRFGYADVDLLQFGPAPEVSNKKLKVENEEKKELTAEEKA